MEGEGFHQPFRLEAYLRFFFCTCGSLLAACLAQIPGYRATASLPPRPVANNHATLNMMLTKTCPSWAE
jgi:hypothetical protein